MLHDAQLHAHHSLPATANSCFCMQNLKIPQEGLHSIHCLHSGGFEIHWIIISTIPCE